MVLTSIIFDSRNPNWGLGNDMANMFIKTQENHMNQIVKCRGYLYLNEICELLNAKWNPDDENMCIKNDDENKTKFVRLEVFSNISDDCWSIFVHKYD